MPKLLSYGWPTGYLELVSNATWTRKSFTKCVSARVEFQPNSSMRVLACAKMVQFCVIKRNLFYKNILLIFFFLCSAVTEVKSSIGKDLIRSIKVRLLRIMVRVVEFHREIWLKCSLLVLEFAKMMQFYAIRIELKNRVHTSIKQAW